jgi:hypothetical protein
MRPRSSAVDPRVQQIQGVGGGDAAGRVEHHVGDEALAGLEVQDGLARRAVGHLDRLHGLAEAERDVARAHLVEQLVDDLAVEELEGPLPPLDQRHRHAEGGEDRGVLDADDARADHGECPRELLQLHHVVGVQDDLAVGPDPRRVGRMGADRDQDVLGGDLPPAAVRADHQRVGIDERGLAGQERHVVAAELVLDHLDLAGDHDVDAGEELLAGGPRVEPGPRQSVALAREPGEGDHRLAQGLARDGAGVDADAAHGAALLDDGGAMAQLGGLNGGPLARRAAADADQVVLVGIAHVVRQSARARIMPDGSLARSAPGEPLRVSICFCTRARAGADFGSIRGCLFVRQGWAIARRIGSDVGPAAYT